VRDLAKTFESGCRKGANGGHKLALHRLEACHALGLEELHGIGFELVVTSKALSRHNHALGPVLRHGADEIQGELPAPGR